MENSVTAIIDADKKARTISAAAEKEAEKLIADAKAARDGLAKENSEKLAAEAEKRSSALKAFSDKEIAEAEKNAEQKCRILDEKMTAGKEAWKKEIIGRILG